MNTTTLVVLGLLFVGITLLANVALRGWRIDLTENRLYSIAPGTQAILDRIDEPINLYFFYSAAAAVQVPQLNAFGRRVRDLLEEFADRADGGVQLQIIDPEPFSEAEDRAAELGVEAIPYGANGENLYLGLAGTNSTDGREAIAFFAPHREEFLEYDIARLVNSLQQGQRPVLGLASGLPMTGGLDPASGMPSPPWAILDQLRELVEIRQLQLDGKPIPAEIGTLMIVHPKNLGDSALYSIDQFVMRGGRLLLFVDPRAEADMSGQGPLDDPFASASAQSSDPGPLLDAWGIEFDASQIIGDAVHALPVTVSDSRAPQRHLAILGFGPDAMNADDVVTAGLNAINMATAGSLAPKNGRASSFEPLIVSSDEAAPLARERFAMLTDPSALLDGFEPSGENYVLAARVSGRLQSAYPDGAPSGAEQDFGEHLPESDGESNLIVFADTDLLSDPMWMQSQMMFGQTVGVAFANNGDLVANSVDNLAGSSDLISVRGRQSFFRPFEKVEDLRRQADERLRMTEQQLESELAETEQKLLELQTRRDDQSATILSAEQETELERFKEQQRRIRRELRDVRLQLDRDIERLGSRIKIVNILLVPLAIIVIGLFVTLMRRQRRRSALADIEAGVA